MVCHIDPRMHNADAVPRVWGAISGYAAMMHQAENSTARGLLVARLHLLRARLGRSLIGYEDTCGLIERTISHGSLPTILAWGGARVGTGVSLRPFTLDNATNGFENLETGDEVFIGRRCFFDLADKIIIQSGAALSGNVQVYTHGDVGHRPLAPYMPRRQGPVLIGQGAWVGAGAILLPGTSVGAMSVVGAGSVVTRPLPPGGVFAGVPAVMIKALPLRER